MARAILGFAAFLCAMLHGVGAAHAQFVAEQVTVGNAATHLFQGSDAVGGIDDWYLSNGVVEVIIDDVGVQSVPVGATAPPKQTLVNPTGGTVIDVGLVGDDNDQLSQMFTVGGLSTSNFILYDSIGGSTTAGSATITVTGTLLGFEPDVLPSELLVTTEYTVESTDNFMTITTTVENTSGNTAPNLTGVLDVFAWVTRALVPFSPQAPYGFNHAELDLGSPTLELPIWFGAPGNLGPDDGVMDPPSGKSAGEVSYGYLGVEFQQDPDAGGPTPPTVSVVNRLFGVSNNLITAFSQFPPGPSLGAGRSLTYVRRLYVGDKNDVAAVSNDIYPELAGRAAFTFATGTISGDVDASDDPDIAASAVATRTAGPPAIAGLANGSPTTHFRTDSTGAFSGVVLPEGTYDITFKTPERDDVTATGVVVTGASNTPVAVPTMTAQGFAEITMFEKVKGVGKVDVPGRATFVGVGECTSGKVGKPCVIDSDCDGTCGPGTPNPRFAHDFDALLLDGGVPVDDIDPETFAGGLEQGNFVYVAGATKTVGLRPGTYQVYGSHGPEYTLKRKKAKIKEGKTKKLKLKVKRVVPTPDAMSADFHIHSGRSFDTSPPLEGRVVTFAGEQVEVMVSTDHEYHTDYSSIIASLGLDGITSVIGNEVTAAVPNPPAFPDAIGHINAWPLTVDADAKRDGAIEDEYVAPNLLYSRLRAQGADVVQYNHPRAGLSGITQIGFFNNIGYDPDTVVTSPPNDLLLDDDVLGPGISGVANPEGNRNIDFDCMEIMNGVDIGDYFEVRRDWFSLLNQTDGTTVPSITGTSVSDSHRLTLETAGYGRSYVLGVGDDPGALDVSAMNTNVKAGKLVGTTGPYIEFTMEDAAATEVGLGETLDPSTDLVRLKITVSATHWIPVEEVRIYRNGYLVDTFDETTTPGISKPKKATSGSKKTTRFSASTIEYNLTEDSWFVVEAGQAISPLPSPDPTTNLIVPGLESVAFTNPIWVDLDGDGFDPPGLPVEASPAPVPPSFRSVAELDLAKLSAHKRHAVLAHVPIYKISIPPESVAALEGAE